MKLPPKSLRTFAWITAAGLFLVLFMGFVVTETGSGRGCGASWPLCHGKFIPTFAFHTLIEFSHRSLAAIVGVLVFLLFLWSWRAVGRRPFVKVLGAVGLLFVMVQAGIGAADVLHPQSAEILALHFGFALIAFASVVLLAVVLGQPGRSLLAVPDTGAGVRRFRVLAVLTFVAIYGVVYLGAYVSHRGAEGACHGWPLCDGTLIPALKGLTAVIFFHRLAALGAIVLVTWLFVEARRRFRSGRRDLVRTAHAALALIYLQALSGGLLVFSNFALFAILIHVGLMAILFAATAYLFLHAALGLTEDALSPEVAVSG